MKFGVAYAVAFLLVGTRLLSHIPNPDVTSIVMITLVSMSFAAPPIAVWWAFDRRRSS